MNELDPVLRERLADMSRCQKEKCAFVDLYLGLALRECNAGIAGAEYTVEGYDEFVTVTFDGGSTQKICVNCDSHIAIMRDVLKNIRL